MATWCRNNLGGRIVTLDRDIYFRDENRTKYHADRMYMLECWYASQYNNKITTCFNCPFPDCVHFLNKYGDISTLRRMLENKAPGYKKESIRFMRLRFGKELCKV